MAKLHTTPRLHALAVICAALMYAPFASAQQSPPATGGSPAIKKMDTDKDSQVTKEEYMKYQEKKFDAMDKTKDKKLTQDEWEQGQLQRGSEGEGD